MRAAKKGVCYIASSGWQNNFVPKTLLGFMHSGYIPGGTAVAGSMDSLAHTSTVPLRHHCIWLESYKTESDVEKSFSSDFSTILGGRICSEIGLFYALKHEGACSLGLYFSGLNWMWFRAMWPLEGRQSWRGSVAALKPSQFATHCI